VPACIDSLSPACGDLRGRREETRKGVYALRPLSALVSRLLGLKLKGIDDDSLLRKKDDKEGTDFTFLASFKASQLLLFVISSTQAHQSPTILRIVISPFSSIFHNYFHYQLIKSTAEVEALIPSTLKQSS
jgi:hypothetical protein